MFRTQIRLTAARQKALRRLPAITGQPTAERTRKAADEFLPGQRMAPTEGRIERAIRVAGMFASGDAGASADHDRQRGEAFRR
jgi:hypothetical protein